MAIQFNTNNTGTVYTAATAIDAFRLGLMVNPTTGANVSRALADRRADIQSVFGFTSTADQDAPILHITTLTTPATAGSYAITDRTIIINGDSAALIASITGTHISFYNCRFLIRDWNDNNPTLSPPIGTFLTAGDTADREIPTNFLAPTTGRSINCYGCTIHIAEETARHNNVFGNFGDFIGSDITFGGNSSRPTGLAVNFTYQTGGRFIDSTHVCNPNFTSLQSLQGYSFASVFENARLYSCGMTSGNSTSAVSAGSGPRLLTEAQFTYDDQTNYFSIQADVRGGGWTAAANSFLQLGFRTPTSNSDRDDGVIANNSAGNPGADYLDIVNGAGAVYNFAGYLPTYNDLATGTPIENVRVRVATSALKRTDATVVTGVSGWPAQLLADDTEKTLGTNFYANEYLTDTTGQLVTSRNTLDGWTTSTAGSYDPFRFDNRTATGSSQLASLDLDTIVLDAPEHCAPVLLQHLKGTASGTGNANRGFTRHQARYQARSYTHAVSEDFTESSTTLPDGSARGTSTDYGIDRTVRNELMRTGTTRTETESLDLFDAVGDKSPKDSYEYLLANWSTYRSDAEPIGVGNTFTTTASVVLFATDAAPTITPTAITLNRVTKLVASEGVNTISASSIIINTDVDGANLTASGNINIGPSSTIVNSTLTAGSFTNFPSILDGTILFAGTHTVDTTGTIHVNDKRAVAGLNLVVNSPAILTVTGAVESDFASVTGTGDVVYSFSTTITTDASNGILSIQKADGTGAFIHRANSDSVTLSAAELPAGTYRAVFTAKGRAGLPVEIVVDGATDHSLTSQDLTPLGYSSSINIGSSRTYTKTQYNNRSTVITSETGKNDYYADPRESVKWFGDLYGEEDTNEVLIENFDITADTHLFTLNATTSVTSVNLPIVRALHSTGVDGVLRFSADITNAVALFATYELTNNISMTVTADAGAGVSSAPNSVGALAGTMVLEIDRSIEAINTNTDAEVAQVTSDVRAMRDNRLLGLKPQTPRS